MSVEEIDLPYTILTRPAAPVTASVTATVSAHGLGHGHGHGLGLGPGPSAIPARQMS